MLEPAFATYYQLQRPWPYQIRQKSFIRHVSGMLGCLVVVGWLEGTGKGLQLTAQAALTALIRVTPMDRCPVQKVHLCSKSGRGG